MITAGLFAGLFEEPAGDAVQRVVAPLAVQVYRGGKLQCPLCRHSRTLALRAVWEVIGRKDIVPHPVRRCVLSDTSW